MISLFVNFDEIKRIEFIPQSLRAFREYFSKTTVISNDMVVSGVRIKKELSAIEETKATLVENVFTLRNTAGMSGLRYSLQKKNIGFGFLTTLFVYRHNLAKNLLPMIL